MAGQMGAGQVTIQNLEIVGADDDAGLLLVKGSVPGSKGGWVLIQDAVKKLLNEDAPTPAGLIERPVEEVTSTETIAEEPVENALEETTEKVTEKALVEEAAVAVPDDVEAGEALDDLDDASKGGGKKE